MGQVAMSEAMVVKITVTGVQGTATQDDTRRMDGNYNRAVLTFFCPC